MRLKYCDFGKESWIIQSPCKKLFHVVQKMFHVVDSVGPKRFVSRGHKNPDSPVWEVVGQKADLELCEFLHRPKQIANLG
jgi:hypothetical protein